MNQRRLSPRYFWGLILCNLIWSAHPTMGKLALESLSPVHVAWMRYSSALIFYIGAVFLLRFFNPAFKTPGFVLPQGDQPGRMFLMLLGLGFATFCFAPLFQMTGLAQAKAIDNALIVAMEPLMTLFLAWIFLREKLSRLHLFSFALALGGFALLTKLNAARVQQGWDTHLWGSFLMLTALAGEAMYSILGRKLISKYSPISVFGTALSLGVICLTLYTAIVEGFPSLQLMQAISLRSWVALFWMGPLGTTATYLFWMIALVNAPIASLALTLFVQPVLGALLGYAFLGERLTGLQWAGGLLILVAVLAQVRKMPETPHISL